MAEPTLEERGQNPRSEHAAICSNLNRLVFFRFMLVGYYVAARVGSPQAPSARFCSYCE